MFATFVYQENKMEFYAAWDLAEKQRSTGEEDESLKAKPRHHLPAPLVAKSDPYLVADSKKFEEEEDESDSSSDSSSEDKKTDDTSSSDTEESKTEELKPNPAEPSSSPTVKQPQPNPAEPDASPTVNQSQNLVTVNCGHEKKEERMDVKKEVKEESADQEMKDLKRPAGDPPDDDPVVKRLRKVRKDLEDSTCILETLTTALTRGGIDPEDQVVGATPKWIPPPQQAPQPPQAQAQASQPAPQQVPVVPVKAMPTQAAPKAPAEAVAVKARPTQPVVPAKAPQQTTAKAPQATAKAPQQATAKAPQQASTTPWSQQQPLPSPPRQQYIVTPMACPPPPPESNPPKSPPAEPCAAKAAGADRVRGLAGPQYEGHMYVPLLGLSYIFHWLVIL